MVKQKPALGKILFDTAFECCTFARIQIDGFDRDDFPCAIDNCKKVDV